MELQQKFLHCRQSTTPPRSGHGWSELGGVVDNAMTSHLLMPGLRTGKALMQMMETLFNYNPYINRVPM